MTDIREELAETIEANDHKSYLKQADAVLAAMPDMVPELVWVAREKRNRNDYHGSPDQVTKYWSKCGSYTLSCNWGTGGSWDALTGRFHRVGHLTEVVGGVCVSFAAAKAAANAHHRAQVMRSLGIDQC